MANPKHHNTHVDIHQQRIHIAGYVNRIRPFSTVEHLFAGAHLGSDTTKCIHLYCIVLLRETKSDGIFCQFTQKKVLENMNRTSRTLCIHSYQTQCQQYSRNKANEHYLCSQSNVSKIHYSYSIAISFRTQHFETTIMIFLSTITTLNRRIPSAVAL